MHISYNNKFVEDVKSCYNYVWDTNRDLPCVEEVFCEYIDYEMARIIEYIGGKYIEAGQMEEANRIFLSCSLDEKDLAVFNLENVFSKRALIDLKTTIRYLLGDLKISYFDDEAKYFQNLAQRCLW